MSEEIKNILITEELSIGVSRDDCLLRFRGKVQNESEEYNIVIPLDQLREFIMALFKIGIEYQNETQKNIGFGLDTEEEDND